MRSDNMGDGMGLDWLLFVLYWTFFFYGISFVSLFIYSFVDLIIFPFYTEVVYSTHWSSHVCTKLESMGPRARNVGLAALALFVSNCGKLSSPLLRASRS